MQDETNYHRPGSISRRLGPVIGIEEGLAAMDAGQEADADVVFEQLEQKYPFLKTP